MTTGDPMPHDQTPPGRAARTSGTAHPEHASESHRSIAVRLRRNRAQPWVRRMVAETALTPADLIWPVFLIEGEGESADVPSMPGVRRYSIDRAVAAIAEARDLGIPAVALFPFVPPERKTADCAEAWRADNLVCRAIRAIKADVPDVGLICDVALDPYNAHGHDGLVADDGRILNDATVAALVQQALVQAEAGCDIVAPSDMMDGRVGAIRAGLDAAGHTDVRIMSYAAKYASGFYGPFRDAVGSGGFLAGDKKTYQMDPANTDEAMREVALDLDEGADMIMVKPGMPYLDILHRVKTTFRVPTFAYQVSGEYAMVKAAVRQGWLDNDRVVMESLLSFKRAGADGVLTYSAIEAAQRLKAG
jgi:porphobilinogen synthase